MKKELSFPKDFLWGTATASHQVEGNTANDWSVWEKKHAKRLAHESASQFSYLPHWKVFEKEATNPQNYISGKTCDHYNRFREDFDIAKSLNHNAHRFSIEWSRIEPEEGRFNEKEIEHYRQVIKSLRERDIEPFVTLWHWPIPLWLRDKGGWQSRKMPEYFARYVEKIIFALKDDVKFWLTLNEPEIYADQSYLKGNWPPQKKDLASYLLVINNLIKSHRRAYKIIKKLNKNAQIGIAKNNIYFEAYRDKPINRLLKKYKDWSWNYYFLNRIKNYQDFIGLNHYFHNRIKNFKFNQNENKKISDVGWELYPEAIRHCLIGLKKYNLPIYITENGLADAKDENRKWFIKESLKNIHKTIQEGVDVRGYFYWSLLDNFEWDKGFWLRFGLIKVDYTTQKRTVRLSALAYAEICKNNSLKM